MGWLSDIWNKAKNWVSNAYNTVKEGASNIWNRYVKPVAGAIPIVGSKIVGGVEGLAGAVDKGAQAVGSLAKGDVVGAYNAGKDAFNQGKGAAAALTTLKKGGMIVGSGGAADMKAMAAGKTVMAPQMVPMRHRRVYQK